MVWGGFSRWEVGGRVGEGGREGGAYGFFVGGQAVFLCGWDVDSVGVRVCRAGASLLVF